MSHLTRVSFTRRFSSASIKTELIMKMMRSISQLVAGKRRMSSYIRTSKLGQVTIPETSLTKYILAGANRFPEHLPSLTAGETGRQYTIKDMKDRVKKFKLSLKRHVGLKEKDVVGVILPNCPTFLYTCFGAIENGLVVSFINPIYTVDETAFQFGNAEVKCIIANGENAEKAKAIGAKLKDYRGTIIVEEDDWEFNGKTFQPGDTPDFEVHMNAHDTVVLPYSSGTTGVPKGVELSHYNLISNIEMLSHPELTAWMETTETQQDRVLSIIPFFHIYGFNLIMNHEFYRGAHVITLPKFEPEEFIKAVKTYKPTTIFTVPALLLFMASHPAMKPEYLECLRTVPVGAAPSSRELIRKFLDKVPNKETRLVQGYGMTETAPLITFYPPRSPESKLGSAGQIVSSTEAKVIDLETGKTLSSNKEGELCIRGPQVMKGYFKNEEATKNTIDEEGWLHTGDVAYYDEDEYFYIVDRTKELIKVKGNQVSPTELEGRILEIDGVADVAVVGVPDEGVGELPRAYVVLKPNAKLTEEEIKHYLKDKVAPYKQLKGGVKFIEAVPRNHTGKILRRNLKDL